MFILLYQERINIGVFLQCVFMSIAIYDLYLNEWWRFHLGLIKRDDKQKSYVCGVQKQKGILDI